MALENMYKDLKGNGSSLLDWSLERVAADFTGADLYEGRYWYNTTEGAIKYYNGTIVETLATLTDLTKIGTFQGVHDASGGAVPTTTLDGSAIVAGDYWRVSVAGTIVGIGGDDALEIGDLVFANVDAAAVAGDFTAIQANIDLPGNIAQVEEVVIATLAKNVVTAVPTTFTEVYSIQVFNSADEEIGVAITGATTAPAIEANKDLAGVKVRLVGK